MYVDLKKVVSVFQVKKTRKGRRGENGTGCGFAEQ